MKGKIFNAQEVQAIIAGLKTMFREVIKTQTKTNEPLNLAYTTPYRTWEWGNSGVYVEEPYEVGQKIFVKESFGVDWFNDICFKATDQAEYAVSSWKPASRMEQEHSRLTLEITDIKVERLQDIREEDAIKEGATSRPYCHGYANKYNGWSMNWSKVGEASKWAFNGKTLSESDVCMGSAEYAFAHYWNATHKKPEEKFETNPFVWVVDFKINK